MTVHAHHVGVALLRLELDRAAPRNLLNHSYCSSSLKMLNNANKKNSSCIYG
jgi:hypothetical protein